MCRPNRCHMPEERIDKVQSYMAAIYTRCRHKTDIFIITVAYSATATLAVADPGGGGGGGVRAPLFVLRCRLFNIGPKVGPPL